MKNQLRSVAGMHDSLLLQDPEDVPVAQVKVLPQQ